MDIRAVLFDLDDTLVAFDAVTERSWKQVWAEYCAIKPGLDPAALYGAVRESSSRYWSDPERHRTGRLNIIEARKRFVREAFAGLGLPVQDAEDAAVRYSRVRLDNMFLFPGARETLELLKARGCGMALLTNGDSAGQREKVRRFGLEAYFRAILVEEELGFGKPDPRVFRMALSALDVPAENAVMVGDNPEWDILPAQREGIRAVRVDAKGEGDRAGADGKRPDWTIAGVADLPRVLGLTAAAP